MTTIIIQIQSDASVASDLLADIQAKTSATLTSSHAVGNLDGLPETVVQGLQVMTTLVTAITPVLLKYLERKQVKKITVGDTTIENPTAEQCERVLVAPHAAGK